MKLKTKIVALASTALLFVGAAFGVGISLSNANAEEWTASATEWQWEDSYLFGSTLDIPAYTVTVGGESLATNAVVTYPNGTTTTETSLSLEQAGVYTVSYYASKGGKEYVKTVTFEVGYKAYYVTSERSSVEYGEYTNYGAEYQAHTNKGLLVRLANGDKLEFAHLIDVKELTAKKSLMTGFITPDAFNVADFDKFIVTLTDSKDPSIYLQIDINRWTLFAGPSDGGKATTFVSAGGMLNAFNTGHDGSMSTGHGNSPKDMLRRLETMVLMGVDMPVSAIRGQIASAIDILVYLGRLRDHSRRVLEITEIVDYQDSEILLNPLFTFQELENSTSEKVIGTLKATGNSLRNTFKLQMAGYEL